MKLSKKKNKKTYIKHDHKLCNFRLENKFNQALRVFSEKKTIRFLILIALS